MPLAGLKYQSVTFGKAHQKTMSSSYIYGEWEFRTRVRVEFLKQKIRKKVLEHKSKSTSTSPERGREPRRWTRRGWWNPRRLMRLEYRGVRENRAILEALRMDGVDKMNRKMVGRRRRRRRRSIQTVLHLVLRPAFLAQSGWTAVRRDCFPEGWIDTEGVGRPERRRLLSSSGPWSRDPHERWRNWNLDCNPEEDYLSFAVSGSQGTFPR